MSELSKVSENDEIGKAVDAVRAGTKDRGIWVKDRGRDRGRLFDSICSGREVPGSSSDSRGTVT